ncbi:hypothetical protein SELMODRAFT_409705 [Selaginella moellendorffii]|uniref:Uncharacterized protein n=1 Tax=Selaginella moellendorffii TaxID=88036 RepID=D8RC66_SELML|nr:hypothetical protein SELMODRAFT_409705 [Selaginella moellendorffii]
MWVKIQPVCICEDSITVFSGVVASSSSRAGKTKRWIGFISWRAWIWEEFDTRAERVEMEKSTTTLSISQARSYFTKLHHHDHHDHQQSEARRNQQKRPPADTCQRVSRLPFLPPKVAAAPVSSSSEALAGGWLLKVLKIWNPRCCCDHHCFVSRILDTGKWDLTTEGKAKAPEVDDAREGVMAGWIRG